MATDYDVPRKRAEDTDDNRLEELEALERTPHSALATLDEEDPTASEDFELPGADLSGIELAVHVVPKQNDEFTCSRCFLVYHERLLAHEHGEVRVCTDCDN